MSLLPTIEGDACCNVCWTERWEKRAGSKVFKGRTAVGRGRVGKRGLRWRVRLRCVGCLVSLSGGTQSDKGTKAIGGGPTASLSGVHSEAVGSRGAVNWLMALTIVQTVGKEGYVAGSTKRFRVTRVILGEYYLHNWSIVVLKGGGANPLCVVRHTL